MKTDGIPEDPTVENSTLMSERGSRIVAGVFLATALIVAGIDVASQFRVQSQAFEYLILPLGATLLFTISALACINLIRLRKYLWLSLFGALSCVMMIVYEVGKALRYW